MISALTRDIFKPAKVSAKILLFGIFILLLDQVTKYLTFKFIPLVDQVPYVYPYGGIGVFRNWLGVEFSLNYMTNKGAAWGILGHYQFPLVLLRIGLILAMSFYLFFINKHKSWQLPLIAIMMGALGNVLDFFVYGHVIDMLHFVLWGYEFPIFNVADSFISVGIFSLLILSWFNKT